MIEDDTPSFGHIADPEFTPEDIDEWPAYAFIFDEDSCASVKYYSQLRDLKKIDAQQGQTVSIVALHSNDNIGLSNIRKGDVKENYQLMTDDRSPVASKVWGTVFKVAEGQTEFRQVLMPVTSDVTLKVIEAPKTFSQASIELKGFHNTWELFSGTYASDGSATGKLTTTGEDVSAGLFPPQESQTTVGMNVSIKLGGITYQTQLNVERKALVRTSTEISIDFSRYAKGGKIDVVLSYRSIVNPQAANEVKKTISTGTSTQKADNRHYSVQVNEEDMWTEQKVYDALCSNADKHSQIWNDWANRKAQRDTMSYCLIDTEFPAKIRVRKNTSTYSSVEIRPSTYGITAEDCGDNTIEFTIPSEAKGKISVEFNGDRQHNLFIYARKPDQSKPSKDDPNVRYFGPGEHNPGTITVYSGQTLYIDYGAKVYANVKTQGSNVTIAGHGILSGEKMKHHGDSQYSWGDFLINHNTTKSHVSNLVIKDITMIDSPGWNLIIPQTDGVVIDGVNMISWELNGDGIDIVSSRNVEIKNCFIRAYDDAITLKCRFIVSPITDVSNVNIHDCLIWSDYARGIVIGPEAGNRESTGRIHDIKVKDCIFLQHKRGLDDDLRAAFAIGQGSDGGSALWSGSAPPQPIYNVYASGLYFDNIDKTGRHTAIWQYGNSGVYMDNINLSNFTIIDKKGNTYPALTIKTNGASIYGLKISNFTVNGEKLTSSSSKIKIDRPGNVSLTVN